MKRLIQLNRKLQVLKDFKHSIHGRWRKEFDHELATFADEALLGRLPSSRIAPHKATIEGRTGA
jgi:hypothetical protein